MIAALYEPGVPALRVSGHAQYAPKGADIVCAAASVLVYALLEAAGGAEELEPPGQTADSVAPLFALRGGEGDREAFRVVAGGFRLLARQFPENVKFEVRE